MLRILLLSFFTVMFVACSPASAVPVLTEAFVSTSGPQAYTQVYTDALDRSVTIATKPARIISLAPSVTEILFAIGAGPQVVGRTTACNYPSEVMTLPTIGGFSAKSISLETILELDPDLVVAGSRSQMDVVAALEAQGIVVFTLAPESLADIEAGIQALGEITGNRENAQAVAGEMQFRIEVVKHKVDTIPTEKRLRVFYEVWHEPLTTTTRGTFIGELLMLAGAVNIFNDLPGTYPEISAEQIMESDPQVILGPSSHSDQLTAEMIGARPGWDRLSAVKNGSIYIVDSNIISRAGPRVVDALEAISKSLYPELFGK